MAKKIVAFYTVWGKLGPGSGFWNRVSSSCYISLLVIVYPMHWIDPLISFFRLSVCLLTDRLITSTVLYRFSRNFACSSEMWSLRRVLFVGKTGSSLRILEMCGFRFWQFSGSGDHIFQQISTKSHIQIKFSNADFVFSGE